MEGQEQEQMRPILRYNRDQGAKPKVGQAQDYRLQNMNRNAVGPRVRVRGPQAGDESFVELEEVDRTRALENFH